MRLRTWHIAVLASLGVGVVVVGLWERYVAQERDALRHTFLGFDHPVSPDVVTRAASLVREHLRPLGATVRADGQQIAIEVDDPMKSLDVFEALHVDRVRFKLRVVEDYAPYISRLAHHVHTDRRATDLGVSAETGVVGSGGDSHLEVFLVASDDGKYVNTAWAEKHHCDSRRRVEGTGVYCTITGEQRIAAYVFGDAELFSEPDVDEQPPKDHTLMFEQTGERSRTHYVQVAPLILEHKDIAGITRTWGDAPSLAIDLRVSAGAAVTAATSSGARIAIELAGALRPARIATRNGGTVRLEIDVSPVEAESYVYAFELAELPARLL